MIRHSPRARRWVTAAATVLVLLVSILPASRARAAVGCDVTDVRLANGLRVLVCPVAAGSGVAVQVRYDVGSRDEPGGLGGLAHLTEHLMFTGSRHVPANSHLRLLSSVGATDLNGTTTWDSTAYFETVPVEQLELALWLESDRMGYALDRIDQATLDKERAVVLNEYLERVNDAANGAIPGLLDAELFPAWHPYHRITTGTTGSIQAIRLADVRAFMGTWYAPGNAVLAIAGPVDPAATVALARRYFESLPARATPVRPALPPIPAPDAARLEIGSLAIYKSVSLSWVTPPFLAAGDAELDVAAWILRSRLSKRLGTKTVGVGAAQSSEALASVFSVKVVLSQGVEHEEGERAIDEALSDLARGVPPGDVRMARASWYATSLFRLESANGWTTKLTMASTRRSSFGFFDGDLGRFAAITPEAVQAAVQAHLRPERRVVVATVFAKGQPLRGAVMRRVTR